MFALSTLTLMLFFITKNISVIVLFQFVIFNLYIRVAMV